MISVINEDCVRLCCAVLENKMKNSLLKATLPVTLRQINESYDKFNGFFSFLLF